MTKDDKRQVAREALRRCFSRIGGSDARRLAEQIAEACDGEPDVRRRVLERLRRAGLRVPAELVSWRS